MKTPENNFNSYSVSKEEFYSTHLNIDFKFWIQKVYDLKSQFPTVFKSNRGGWQSDDITYNPIFYDLVFLLNKVLSNFSKSPHLKIEDLWINISSFGNYNSVHNHTPDKIKKEVISGVLYLKTPTNCGDIIFYNSLDFNRQRSVAPETGKLLLFSSHLYHSVAPNFSQEDRISIAFNSNQGEGF